MGKRSTRLKIAFFSLLLLGFIVIQCCWLISLHKERTSASKYGIITEINGVAQTIQLPEPRDTTMSWAIATSVLLTVMITVIFYYAAILSTRNQQRYFDNRTKVIKHMLQQLEAPLSTVSVAAEALRNARVMQDAAQVNYYQRIINEESQRMNEQVKQFLQALK